jgi:UDP-glucose:glycoprotein glucosyltransferase
LLSKNLLHTITAEDLLSLIDELDNSGEEDNQAGKTKRSTGQKVLGDVNSPLHAFTSSWDAADIALAAEFWQIGFTVAEKLGLRTT